jgi:hypothetical protein
MCGDDSRDIAGLPIDQFQKTIQLTDAQRAALNDLAAASATAAQDIKAACPADIALTAPGRLANMQQRIEAMIAAVAVIKSPLDRFYGLLSDEQKLRLTALGKDQRQSQGQKTAGSLAPTCGAPPAPAEWPAAAIDRTVRPTETERVKLVALENATTEAANVLKASCQGDNALTPPARLDMVGKRLDAMLQAVNMVRSALDGFYATLNDEQKAKFEAIGPQRTSAAESTGVRQTVDSDRTWPRQTHYRGRSIEGGVENLIRNLLPF